LKLHFCTVKSLFYILQHISWNMLKIEEKWLFNAEIILHFSFWQTTGVC
jgi:hypothetical protein